MWIGYSWKLLSSWDLSRESRLWSKASSSPCWRISLCLLERREERWSGRQLQGTEPGQRELSGPDLGFTGERVSCFPVRSKRKAVNLVQQGWEAGKLHLPLQILFSREKKSCLFHHRRLVKKVATAYGSRDIIWASAAESQLTPWGKRDHQKLPWSWIAGLPEDCTS